MIQVMQGEFEGEQGGRDAPRPDTGAGSAFFFFIVLFLLVGRLGRINRGSAKSVTFWRPTFPSNPMTPMSSKA